MIQARIVAVNKGEDEHDDILSHILQIAQRDENTTLEDLVDHFLTFVVGGNVISLEIFRRCIAIMFQGAFDACNQIFHFVSWTRAFTRI